MNGFNFSDFLTNMMGRTQSPAMMQGDFSGLGANMGPAFTSAVKGLNDPENALAYLESYPKRRKRSTERDSENSAVIYDPEQEEERRRKLAQQRAVKEMMQQMMKNQRRSRTKGRGPAFQYGRQNPMTFRGGLG